MKRPWILIVEDEPDIAQLLIISCQRENFDAVIAENLNQAQHQLNLRLPQAIILDRMLPDGDGVAWLQNIRQDMRTRHVPVLLLTAKNSESDKLEGFECGADDYIDKPFSPKELMARIQAVLRRSAPHHSAIITEYSGNRLDDENHSLSNGEKSVTLSNSEYQLLKFFWTHPNKNHTRRQLLDWVWGEHIFIEERTIDVHILRLRKILQNFNIEHHLQTIRSIGYRWNQ